MAKVRDNSAPKMILGACSGARAIARHSSPSLPSDNTLPQPTLLGLVCSLHTISYNGIVDSTLSRQETDQANPNSASFLVAIFFNCYLAVPRPTLGHCRGGSLTNPMLITAFPTILTGRSAGVL